MILGQEQNSTLSTGGVTPNNLAALETSKQHNEYSINGAPYIPNKPAASSLDLQGATPPQYLNNLPQ